MFVASACASDEKQNREVYFIDIIYGLSYDDY